MKSDMGFPTTSTDLSTLLTMIQFVRIVLHSRVIYLYVLLTVVLTGNLQVLITHCSTRRFTCTFLLTNVLTGNLLVFITYFPTNGYLFTLLLLIDVYTQVIHHLCAVYRMSFEDFVKNFTKLEVCMLEPRGDQMTSANSETEQKTKRAWKMSLHDGSWKRQVNAGGCRNFLGKIRNHTTKQTIDMQVTVQLLLVNLFIA